MQSYYISEMLTMLSSEVKELFLRASQSWNRIFSEKGRMMSKNGTRRKIAYE